MKSIKLVVDATELFIALTGKGVTKDIIMSKYVKLYAPEFLFDELEKHKLRVKELSWLSSNELDKLLNILKKKIKEVPENSFNSFLIKASELISDPNDAEYLALSLSLNNTPIWSEDKHFKESLVKEVVEVFTTKELVKHLKSLGIEF